MKRNFYTYLWLREDGSPYYVGKGEGRRAFKRHRVVEAPSRDRIVLQEWPSEDDAFAAEILLIAFYGRKDLGTGILRNLTDGGDGVAGLKCSEITRQRMRAAHIGQFPTEATRKKLREIARPKTIEHRRKLAKALTGRIRSVEFCQKQKKAQSERKRNPLTDAHRENIRTSIKEHWRVRRRHV